MSGGSSFLNDPLRHLRASRDFSAQMNSSGYGEGKDLFSPQLSPVKAKGVQSDV